MLESLISAYDENKNGKIEPNEKSYFENNDYGTVTAATYPGELDYTDDATLTDVMKDGTNTNIDYENTDLDQYTYDEIGQMVADKSKEIAEVQWNIQGKPTAFIRTATSTKPDVYFSYDAHGNKISRTRL